MSGYVKKGRIPLELKSNEKCPADCEGKVYANDTYCRHIEDQLPKMPLERSYEKIGGAIENIETPYQGSKAMHEKKFIRLLRAAGLDAHEIELVEQRYRNDLSFSQIVEESGWTSKGAASYVHQKILSKLRKRKFNVR